MFTSTTTENKDQEKESSHLHTKLQARPLLFPLQMLLQVMFLDFRAPFGQAVALGVSQPKV